MWQLQRRMKEGLRRDGGGRRGRGKTVIVITVAVATLVYCVIHVMHKYYDTSQPMVIQSEHPKEKKNWIPAWEEKGEENLQKNSNAIVEEEIVGVKHDDPQLVKFVQQQLEPPSTLPYNLTDPNKTHYSQYGQSKFLDEHFLHGMVGGVFVEAGALDGEHLSNSLYLEKHLGWSGILVEPMPDSYTLLRRKNRRAYTINVALGTTNLSSRVIIRWEGQRGGASHVVKKSGKRKGKANGGKRDVTVLSVPFYSILLALNITQIDFLSLDLEGFELQVLQTVPWDKVRVRIMCIECNKVKPSELTNLLTSVGYRYVGKHGIDCWFGWPSLLAESQ